jgi:hypothetical protein
VSEDERAGRRVVGREALHLLACGGVRDHVPLRVGQSTMCDNDAIDFGT